MWTQIQTSVQFYRENFLASNNAISELGAVTLKIYDTNGRQVRQLSLGIKAAGQYFTRERAAYWDGRNAAGEAVASGVYFYYLEAGRFRATRKLIIQK